MSDLENGTHDADFNAMFGDDDNEKVDFILDLNSKDPLAEVKTILNIGGERGLFAKIDLPVGSLVLSEIPVIVWPECDLTEVENLVQVLQLVCHNQKAIDTTKNLHPRDLSHADTEEITIAKETIDSEVLSNVSKSALLDEDEVLRIFLTLQHNGFSSGLYEFLSIANHSCQPNCIKFMPISRRTGGSESSSRLASEIWTTRPVAAGEELTICYCVPLEMTNRAMQSFLLQHHRFVCQCSKCLSSQLSASSTTTSISDNSALFKEITQLNSKYYGVLPSDGMDVNKSTSDDQCAIAMQAVSDHLSKEGLRMLSGNPPATESHQQTEETTVENTGNNSTVGIPDAQSDHISEPVVTEPPVSDPVSVYIENELESMEGELLWSKLEDPANNLDRYTAMILATEYLLSYFILANSNGLRKNTMDCISQLCARILKISISAAVICLEMFQEIRSNAASVNSRSYDIVNRLKCRKYVKNIVLDKLLFQFVIEIYLKNSFILLQLQAQYLGALHTDLSTTYLDIAHALELLADNFSETECASFWSLLSDKHAILRSINCPTTTTTNGDDVFATVGGQGKVRQFLGGELVKRFKKEGEKVKALYSTARRFPEALTGSRQPGTVYWGSKQALQKIAK